MADWKFDVGAGTTAADVTAASGATKASPIMLAVADSVGRYELLLQLKAFEMAIIDLDPFRRARDAMAYSQVERANAALSAIGAQRITSLTDDSKEARVCNARFEAVRDALLRAHPWNFAMARASLPALSGAPAWGWARAYQLPADTVRVWSVEGLRDEEWTVEGRTILTDASAPLSIRYIRRAENPAIWDAGFAEAFSARLAAGIAADIVDETATTERMWGLYRDKLAEARRSDAQEGSAEWHPQTGWLAARV